MPGKDKKEVSNEDLAEMIAKGFEDTATKEDIRDLGGRMDGMEKRFDGVEERLAIVERKLDKALYREFQRIDKLEDDMKVVKEKLGISE